VVERWHERRPRPTRHSPALVERLRSWNSRYDDSKLPLKGDDTQWLAEGESLLGEVRRALDGVFEIIVTEPWWGEEISDV
jgi:hypothetical protein